jgi:hypothetical protein
VLDEVVKGLAIRGIFLSECEEALVDGNPHATIEELGDEHLLEGLAIRFERTERGFAGFDGPFDFAEQVEGPADVKIGGITVGVNTIDSSVGSRDRGKNAPRTAIERNGGTSSAPLNREALAGLDGALGRCLQRQVFGEQDIDLTGESLVLDLFPPAPHGGYE